MPKAHYPTRDVHRQVAALFPPVWHWSDLWTDPPAERLSVHRLWSNLFALALLFAFAWQAFKRDVTWDDWIGFAASGALILTPALVSKFIGVKYENGGTASTTTRETTSVKTRETAKGRTA